MLTLYLTYISEEKEKSRFEQIYCSYRKQMLVVAMSVVHNTQDAEDVVHEVFLKIARRYMDTVIAIEDERSLRNYLLIAVKRTAYNWLRKYKNIVYMETEIQLENLEKNVPDDRFVDEICRRQEYERVLEAIMTLEEKYKVVLYYHFVLEISVPETAEMLGQSLAATKKQLVRGKKETVDLVGENGRRIKCL